MKIPEYPNKVLISDIREETNNKIIIGLYMSFETDWFAFYEMVVKDITGRTIIEEPERKSIYRVFDKSFDFF